MSFESRFIVQDRESGFFLGLGEDGDMDFFRFINSAFPFEDREAAALSAISRCDMGGFLIFQFYVSVGASRSDREAF